MKLPNQITPVYRQADAIGKFSVSQNLGVNPSAGGGGYCDCSLNGGRCYLTDDQCNPGYHADCNNNVFYCSCFCVKD